MNSKHLLLSGAGVVFLFGSVLMPLLSPAFAVGSLATGVVSYFDDDPTARRLGIALIALGVLFVVAIAVSGVFLVTHDITEGVHTRDF